MGKRKGLPKKYAKMGFKAGWAAYKKAKNSRTKKNTTTRRRTMVRKKTTTKKKSSPIIIDIPEIGFALTAAQGVFDVKGAVTKGSISDGLKHMAQEAVDSFTNTENLVGDIGTAALGYVLLKAIGKVGQKLNNGKRIGGGIPGVVKIRM
jgi:hypothetical protein